MSRRTISGKNRSWLLGEMDVWRAGGMLSEEQAGHILDLYETPAQIAQQKRSLAVLTLLGLAALLVGLAVLLLIGYNWAEMHSALKLSIIFGAIIGTHAAGFYVRYRRNHRHLSEAVFFLGCLLFGSGIWLVAQVFHIQVRFPDGFWFWAVGVLPFVLCLDTLLLHALFVALLAVWAGTEVIGFPGIGAWLFGRWGVLPNGAYTLPLLALPGLLWAYRKRLPVTVALYAPLLAWWVILQPVAWQWEINPVYFIGGVGGLFLFVAENHRSGSPFAVPYRLYGALLSAGALVPLSFIEFNRDILGHDFTAAGLATSLVIVALGAATIALATVLSRKYDPEQKPIGDHLVAIIRQQWLPIGVVLLMAFLALWDTLPSPQDPAAVLPTVVANVAMIFVAFWVMHVGLRDDRVIPFAAGVAYFLLWIVLRYVDLFGDLGGMLGASLMFFLCGATLFGVAVYWRKRKEIRHV